MQINEESVFLYTVNPRKVITGLSGVNTIRTSKSLFLTKEDVKICLQKATVYRRFAAEGINERVTIGNIDRLHREKYISEKDWEAEVSKEMSEGHGKVNYTSEPENPNPELIKNAANTAPVVPNDGSTQNGEDEKKQTGANPEIINSTDETDKAVESDDEEVVLKETDSVVEESVKAE